MENGKANFNYTYSAKTNDEIRRIRSKYLPEEKKEGKLEELRRLDFGVSKKATTWALAFGIIGVLIMGTGMCFVMTELGAYFGLTHNTSMIAGIIIGLAGMTIAGVAYPIYLAIEKRCRAAIAPRIIQLTDELMK